MADICESTHGGNSNIVDLAPQRGIKSKISTPVPAGRAGWIAEIQSHQLRIETATVNILTDVMAVGDVLAKAKTELKAVAGHGHWGQFLQDCGLSDRTAEVYMQLAAGRALIQEAVKANPQRAADMTIRGALKLLPSKKPAHHGVGNGEQPKSTNLCRALAALAKLSADERAQLIANLGITRTDVPAAVQAEIVQHAAAQEQRTADTHQADIHRGQAQCLSVIRTTLATGASPQHKIETIEAAFAVLAKRPQPVADRIDLKASRFIVGNDIAVVTTSPPCMQSADPKTEDDLDIPGFLKRDPPPTIN